MKAKLTKLVAPFAAALLVVPFVVVTSLVAERVAASAGGMQEELLLLTLSIAGALVSVLKNTTRRTGNGRDALALDIVHDHRRSPVGGAFVKASS